MECQICGQEGHTARICWDVEEYVPGLPSKVAVEEAATVVDEEFVEPEEWFGADDECCTRRQYEELLDRVALLAQAVNQLRTELAEIAEVTEAALPDNLQVWGIDQKAKASQAHTAILGIPTQDESLG